MEEWRRRSSTPEVVPGAALPWLELGRVGGYLLVVSLGCLSFLEGCFWGGEWGV